MVFPTRTFPIKLLENFSNRGKGPSSDVGHMTRIFSGTVVYNAAAWRRLSVDCPRLPVPRR